MWQRYFTRTVTFTFAGSLAVLSVLVMAQEQPCPSPETMSSLLLDTGRAVLSSVEGNPLALMALCGWGLTAWFWRSDRGQANADMRALFQHIEALSASLSTASAGIEVLKDRRG